MDPVTWQGRTVAGVSRGQQETVEAESSVSGNAQLSKPGPSGSGFFLPKISWIA
jgi:hypothetical protein